MALIKFGGGVVQMTGSIAGSTFARNRYGNYARARTKPTNPNTAGQQAVRAGLAQLTSWWSDALTVAQRAAWKLYGENVAMKNRLGESIFLTGFNHYVRSNSILWRTNGTMYANGPVVFELPEKDNQFAITASVATQQITVTANPALAWANEDNAFMYIFQGQPQNAQRNFFAGPWKSGGFFAGAAAGPPGFPLPVNAMWPLGLGQHIWCYARILRADARLSEPFRADILVGA